MRERRYIFAFSFLPIPIPTNGWRSLNFVHDPSYERHNKYFRSVVNVHSNDQNVLVLKSHV